VRKGLVKKKERRMGAQVRVSRDCRTWPVISKPVFVTKGYNRLKKLTREEKERKRGREV